MELATEVRVPSRWPGGRRTPRPQGSAASRCSRRRRRRTDKRGSGDHAWRRRLRHVDDRRGALPGSSRLDVQLLGALVAQEPRIVGMNAVPLHHPPHRLPWRDVEPDGEVPVARELVAVGRRPRRAPMRVALRPEPADRTTSRFGGRSTRTCRGRLPGLRGAREPTAARGYSSRRARSLGRRPPTSVPHGCDVKKSSTCRTRTGLLVTYRANAVASVVLPLAPTPSIATDARLRTGTAART